MNQTLEMEFEKSNENRKLTLFNMSTKIMLLHEHGLFKSRHRFFKNQIFLKISQFGLGV